MANSPIKQAAQEIAKQVIRSMECVQRDLEDRVYAYAIVSLDDCSSVLGYANTDSHLASKNKGGTITAQQKCFNKWYFGEWSWNRTDYDTARLMELLGDATEDEDGQTEPKASWLCAMTQGLKLARQEGALCHRGDPVAAFCSMVDSSNAAWLERESARLINSPELFETVETEMEQAARHWYGEQPQTKKPLQVAFEAAWASC